MYSVIPSTEAPPMIAAAIAAYTVLTVGLGQPVRDPAAEYRPGERDRDRGLHPDPQRVVAEQRVRDVEQIRERLPRRRAAEVERSAQRLVAPVEPAVGVISGSRAEDQDQRRRQHEDAERDQPPDVAGDERARAAGSVRRRRSTVLGARGLATSLAWCLTREAPDGTSTCDGLRAPAPAPLADR